MNDEKLDYCEVCSESKYADANAPPPKDTSKVEPMALQIEQIKIEYVQTVSEIEPGVQLKAEKVPNVKEIEPVSGPSDQKKEESEPSKTI